ncbi:LOW QUALITY PROTEIN: protein saal1 [Nylanderia fulva]|uniref:LOW QUALITY PROTEIN: protein saal1 n=1 Tax=Nylanderia fulva TaxID=613905 RepID=UPI0010FBB7A6|nr:LOW QUALITY PROTEIN: protein saal1 [Nylanderia fulva]
MLNSEDLSEQELETLRGDAVGDNLCSSKWIISTLMSLCKIHENGWTDELESQLCILWDLSMEGEVVSHLMLHDFPKIAKDILENYDQPRFIEIILGIIGNMCCNDEVIDTIGNDRDLVAQILNRLASDDAPMLIQLFRIFHLTTWRIQKNPQSNWMAHFMECEFFGESVTFILNSSTNDDLLTSAINLLKSISDISLPHNENLEKLFEMDILMNALLESFMQIISTEKFSHSKTELTFIDHWLRVLTVIIELGSLKFEDFENDESYSKLMEAMYRILKPYEESHNLFPIEELNANVINETIRILLSFHSCDVDIPSKIDHIIVTIIFYLKTGSAEIEELDPGELTITLSQNLIQYWLQIIELCTSNYIAEILHQCKHEVHGYLTDLVQSDSKITPEVLEKLKKATTFDKS